MLVKAPLISVILPCYNHGRFLKKAVKSVFSNCSRNLELIIINDGSSDNTSEVLNDFVSDNRITIIEQDNIGLAESLNKGFNLAKGKYLTWTSADNLYKNFALDKLSYFLDINSDVDMVYADVQLIDDNSKILKNSNYRQANQDSKDSSILRLPRFPETLAVYADNFINACFLYRNWVANELGGYRKELLGYEDYEYWLRILATGKISHLGTYDVLYQYRVHQQSLTGQLNSEKLCKDQRIIVSKYGKLIYQGFNKNNITLKDNLISDFLNSLPLSYYQGSVDAPRILTRVKLADYKAHELRKGTLEAVALFLPDYLTTEEINYYSKLLKNNPKLSFVCITSTIKQTKLITELIKDNLANLIHIDLTKSPEPQDTLLPEESYLPFVYSLSNTKAIICECRDNQLISDAIITLSAATGIQCILLNEQDDVIETPAFATNLNKTSVLKSKIKLNNINHIESSFDSWLTSRSSADMLKKQHKIINLKKLL